MDSFFPFVYLSNKFVKISISSWILILQVTVLASVVFAVTKDHSLDASDNRYSLQHRGLESPTLLVGLVLGAILCTGRLLVLLMQPFTRP